MPILGCLGYGFVDFESPLAAENAVKNLQTQGVQAQMAKVCTDQLHPLKLNDTRELNALSPSPLLLLPTSGLTIKSLI